MAQFFQIHPENPQPRLLRQAVQAIDAGGIVALPTDSSYALVCHLDDKGAVDRLRRIRGIDERHHLTLLCRDLSEISTYARVDNRQYRLLKAATPGPYTFILEATREVPRRLSHPSRKTIGLRVPEHAIAQALLAELRQPLLGTTLMLPGSEEPMNDPEEIREALQRQVDVVIDGGACSLLPTSVVDLTGESPVVLREGRGDVSLFAVTGSASCSDKIAPMNDIIQTIAVYALPIIFAITLHEAAHAYAARYFGDLTAYSQGRMSLNPIKHIDPVGTIAIPLVLALLSSPFLFGYAKPVPADFSRLRQPKRDMLWVALAGPAANLVMALGWMILFFVMDAAALDEVYFFEVAKAGIVVNLVLFAFNLFPLPPLDGGRIMTSLLPNRLAFSFARLEPYGFFIVLALALLNLLKYWMIPVVAAANALLSVLISPLKFLLT